MNSSAGGYLDKKVRRTQSAKNINSQNRQQQIRNQFGQKYNNLVDNRPRTNQTSRGSARPGMPPLNFKTIKFLNNTEAIEVIPKEVVFKNIELNQVYEMVVFVQNLSKTPKRIKIIQPMTSKFRVDYDAQPAIAAGLSMKLVVTFETTSIIEDYSDNVQILYENQVEMNGKIVSQKNKIDLPIQAQRPQPDLMFENYINLGFVRTMKNKVYPLRLINNGTTAANVRFDINQNKNHITFDPPQIKIDPLSEGTTNLVFNAKDTGVFRYSIEVIVQGVPLTKKIDVNATTVEFNRFITDEHGAKQELFDFGEVYFGQKKVIKGFLSNNTPRKQNFKIHMRLGAVNPTEDQGKLLTPQEQGIEMTEQIIKCSPMSGVLHPYSKIPLVFTCKSKVSPKNQVQATKYALTNSNEKDKDFHKDEELEEHFVYTCIVDFDGDEENAALLLNAKGIHPMLKFDKQILNYGDCDVNDHREIIFHVENRHKSLPIEIVVPRQPCFKVTPDRIILEPFMNAPFVSSFIPNNVGKYHKNLEITFINGQYIIPLKAIGSTTIVGSKRPKTRGPECLPDDFFTNNKYIDDENKHIYKLRNVLEETQSTTSQKGLNRKQNFMLNPQDLDLHKEAIEERLLMKQNKDIYVNMIREQKESRMKKKRDKILQTRLQQMDDKIQNEGIEIKNDSDDDQKGPLDLEWEVKMNDVQIEEPQLDLPNAQEPLFVLKPISNYEPMKEQAFKHFHPDPNSQVKKYFDQRPSTHKDTRDIHLELDGESLQKIFAGPKVIDFGEIFVKSRVTKTFTIKNDLRNAILVQLQTSCQELKDTYQKPQIIPSSETGKFQVVLCSQGLDDQFKQSVKYIINKRHEFEFEVTAKICQVKLEANKSLMKFQFAEDNNYMETSEILTISNNGNSSGHFSFDQDSKMFVVEPKSGEVPSKGSMDIRITYRPSLTQDQNRNQREGAGHLRNEEDKLIVRVQDGQDMIIRCIGTVNEPKCILKQQEMNLGEILVSKEEIKFFQIKNTSRIPAIYRVIQERLPDNCTVTPTQGRIAADGTLDLTVKYCNNNPREIIDEILIMIRGGRILKLPFQVKTVIPDVFIREPEFDFGKITILGNSGALTMTIQNDSSIDADLTLDMRGEDEHPDINMVPDGIECLQITAVDEGDESILKSVQFEESDDGKGNDPNDMNDDEFGDQDESESEEDIQDQNTQKLYNFVVRANSVLKFELKFSPKDDKQYSFKLPIALQRYGDKIPKLIREVKCKGIKPKFLVDPQIVEFPRKIITNAEKMFPFTTEINLQNPGKTSLVWRLPENCFQNEQIFSIHPQEGRVDAGQIFRIKASFNPQHPGQYEKVLPLFIDDPDIPANQPCLEIVLKGEAAYPKLVFDRREILMPVTPLDIDSKCIFKIYNDGYENLSLDYRVADELNKLNLKINFPDGRTMGIAKNRIKVEVVFSSPTPLSFTTKIKFIDDAGIEYTIPVSGTTDNSIFTNFQYMQRCKGEYNVECDDKGIIQIIDDDHQAVDNNSDIGSIATTRKGGRYAASVGSGKTFSSKSSQRAGLGYTPIPKEMLDQSKEFIKQWLNGNVLLQNIQSFPENIIENNGDELFQLLTFLTGQNKALQGIQVQVTKNMKRAEKAVILYQQYDDLIRYLKTEGALLNHIRPQFLLSQSDYQAYIKTLPREQIEYVYQHSIKIPFVRYQYINNDAWITLFYQILKLYYISKVSNKILKVIPGLQGGEKQNLPDQYLVGSNLHSPYEGILIRWIELNNELSNNKTVKISNFDSDFSTAHYISGLIKNYLSPLSDQLKQMYQTIKPVVTNEDDCLYNCTILQQILKEIGLATTFNPIELIRQSARENILFFMQLYNALPNYIPKGNPIVFQCVLGESVTKTIELQNPTSKSISYWVKYDGSQDFKPEFEDAIKIEPKATFKFKVTFISRLYTPVLGRLTFTNKKETNVQAAALVFELKSQISGRISIEKWQTKCQLYETKDFTIQVKNTFENAEDGDFSITIVHEKELQQLKKVKEEEENKNNKQKKNPNNNSQQKKKKKTEEDTIQFQDAPFIPSFFCKMQSIRLRRKATYNLTITYVPMVFESQKCFIIFSDPNVGEFQHEIIGNVDLPEEVIDLPKMPIQPPIFVDEQRQYPVQVPFSNPNIKNAKRIIEGYQMAQKARLTTQKNKNQQEQKLFQFPKDQPEFLDFEIELQQPANNAIISKKTLHLINPKIHKKQQQQTQNEGSSKNNLPKMNSQQQNQNNMLSVQSPHETDLDKSGITYSNYGDTVSVLGSDNAEGVGLNQMPLIFHFKNPIRDYKCNIILKNSNLTDVRRYKLNLTSFPRPVKATMEMVAPAKEMVLQEIPIQNNTDRDWHIKVQLQGSEEKNTNYFYVQHPPKEGEGMGKDIKDFIVRKQTIGNIPLIFYPDWICEAQARLVLTNNLTNDVFEYELIGSGEEPLAEDHIVINCIARQTTVKTIEFPNPYPDQGVQYKVETDLIGASGAEKLSVGAKKKKGQYKLSVTPVLSGQYTGSITFTEDNGKYIWYTVHLNTESPPANRCLELLSSIRKAVAVDIELNNPYMDPVTFEVLMEGEGLMGDQYFTILPVSSSSYELIFMPLKTGHQKGSIAFVSDRLGEIWYELSLQAEDSGVIRLPQLKCELGKVESHEVVLENPSSKEQKINVKVSNLSNFEVSPEEIIIPPYDSTYVNIKYFPSSLDTNQQAEIQFESQDIGKWNYLCFGIGVPPTRFEPKVLSIGLNKDYSTVMHFKNPFKDPIQVKILLDLEDYEVGDVIKLLKNKAGKVVIQGLQTIQIPFTFTPTEIREYKASIIVQMNDKIQWVYPIIGITESLSQGLLKVFKTKCRSNMETEFEVSLPGISSIKRGKDDLFNFELQNYPFKEHQFNKIFEMKFIKNYLNSPDDSLKFKVKFQPLKPFKQTIDLIINRQIGGLWKFKLNLESTPPLEDDIIVISSPLHKTTSISFRLTNRNRTLKNFQARFTPDSDAEFAVAPKTGVLEPLGSDGSKFTISFTPIEYGKTRQAKLIIETEEIYWSYIIKGILPKYLPPVKQSNLSQKFTQQKSIEEQQVSKEMSREDSILDPKKNKKNFLTTNIKKTREQSQMLHQMNMSRQQEEKQNPNNISKYSKMNRSGLSPQNNNKNQSNLSILSKNTVHSRVFTAPGGLRRKSKQQ